MPPDDDRARGARKIASGFFGALSAVPLALALVVLLALACIVGTVLPQGGEVGQYLQHNPAAAGRMAVLARLGLTHVFSAWWFIGLLCALAASLATCSARRFTAIFRAAGSLRGRAVGSLMTHTSMLLILAGGVIRGIWGQAGPYRIPKGRNRRAFCHRNGESRAALRHPPGEV